LQQPAITRFLKRIQGVAGLMFYIKKQRIKNKPMRHSQIKNLPKVEGRCSLFSRKNHLITEYPLFLKLYSPRAVNFVSSNSETD
jgi:hypothetical protein